MAQLKPLPSTHLALRQLSRSYSGQPVVDRLDLQIRPGRFIALLGPSGCGKTTTLRMIAGFEQPDGGSIHLGPRLLADARTMVAPEVRGMGMVFQSYALWPHMSVADNVGYALRLRGVRGSGYQRAVTEALEQVEMAAKADAMPQQLSGGQKQRVALARCIAAQPRVILLDEPLANLDRHLRRNMEAAFRRLHQDSGATFIYVTHDQGEAMALADEIAVMHAGRLVQLASPRAVYQQPRNAWLARFIGHGAVLATASTSHDTARADEALSDFRAIHDGLRRALPAPESNPAFILVRPQHVELQTADGAGTGGDASAWLAAVVQHCFFKGERHELDLRLDLPGQQALQAYSASPLHNGARVLVRVRQAWRLAAA